MGSGVLFEFVTILLKKSCSQGSGSSAKVQAHKIVGMKFPTGVLPFAELPLRNLS